LFYKVIINLICPFLSFESGIFSNFSGQKDILQLQSEFKNLSRIRSDEFNAELNYRFSPTKNSREIVQYALSNLLGGIGFFYGTSIINTHGDHEEDYFINAYYDDSKEAADWLEQYSKNRKRAQKISQPMELFTCTPSRAYFPRGFLWDEGFHALLVNRWDPELTREILRSWLSLMDKDGWIAREQILGDEARSRVPEQFVEQQTHIANPPAILLPIDEMLTAAINRLELSQKSQQEEIPIYSTEALQEENFLRETYPKFKMYVEWLHRTQKGDVNSVEIGRGNWDQNSLAYRWRGRTPGYNFASGLDDYPRSARPHWGELHVDLTSWMGFASRLMMRYALFVGDNSHASEVGKRAVHIEQTMSKYFWNEDESLYFDIGIAETLDGMASQHEVHRGYVALLPWILDPLGVSQKAKNGALRLLEELAKDSKCGARSLSKADIFSGRNDNYWTQNVWIHMQWLILRALKSDDSDPVMQSIQKKLRKTVINCITESFVSTGTLWESYVPDTGSGKGQNPFTGWTALIVYILSDQ
jgi:mannosyl-oligosaccharide glucosidase